MIGNMFLAIVQIATSVARLCTFAFTVLTISRVSGDTKLILLMGYLPYLAFFDILIQSISRARHLRGRSEAAQSSAPRLTYAGVALALVALSYAGCFQSADARIAVMYGAWPLGAVAYIWEKHIAQRRRQLALALVELALLAGCVGAYLLFRLSWPTLLLGLVSFPIARLVALALPVAKEPLREADVKGTANEDQSAMRRWHTLVYVGASLGQQAVAASAAALPSLYVSLTGDARDLALHVAIFRSINSLAAVVSLTINSMSSRIFYRQTGTGLTSVELRLLRHARLPLAIVIILAIAATGFAVAVPGMPVLFGVMVLPAMAIINAESSMSYNRGYPQATLHCQLLIFLLSMSFLMILIHKPVGAIAFVVIFASYVILVIPRVLAAHRLIVEHRFGSS